MQVRSKVIIINIIIAIIKLAIIDFRNYNKNSYYYSSLSQTIIIKSFFFVIEYFDIIIITPPNFIINTQLSIYIILNYYYKMLL